MTQQYEEKEWVQRVRGVDIPPELAVLALRALGLAPDLLQRLYGGDGYSTRAAVQAGLQLGRAREPLSGLVGKLELKPFGLAELGALLDAEPLPVTQDTFDLAWVHREGGMDLGGVDRSGPQLSLQSPPAFQTWFDHVRGCFVREQPSLELFLLLPRQARGNGQWNVLRPTVPLRGREDVLRLLCCLSILGLTHRASRHRTRLLPDLVRSSQEIFDHVVVCGTGGRDYRAETEILRRQMDFLGRDILLIRPEPNELDGDETSAHPFALNFSAAWRGGQNEFDSWLIRERAQDADEAADALLWLMVQTSGICVWISLTRRAAGGKKRDVRILAPRPWIKFLKEGHGEKRQTEVFEPYRMRDVPGVPVYHVDEPTRYAQLKKADKKKRTSAKEPRE